MTKSNRKISTILISIFLAGCANSNSGSAPRSDLQFRIVESYDCADCQEFPVKMDTGYDIKLKLGATVIDAQDIASIQAEAGKQNVINIYFHPQAKDKVRKVTTENVGQKMAIVAGGRIVITPEISGSFSDSVQLPVDSRQELVDVYSSVIAQEQK